MEDENHVAQLIAARDLGADVGFLEAIKTPDQIEHAVKTLAPMPVSPSVPTIYLHS